MADFHIRRMLSSYELQDCLEFAWEFMRKELCMEMAKRVIPTHGAGPMISTVKISEVEYSDFITKNAVIGYDVDIATVNPGDEKSVSTREKASFISRLIRELLLVLPSEQTQKLIDMPGVLETLYVEYKEKEDEQT